MSTESRTRTVSPAAILAVVLFLLLGIVILRTAWVCDDAYISFRTVDNFVNGYGLTWNTDERVQGYTNPLWVFLMSLAYWITGDLYYTTIFISLVLTLAAAVLVGLEIARSTSAAIMALVILLFSKAFIDYSTSGLENPLTYVLLALFAYVYLRHDHDLKALFYLSLIACLGTLNRMDTILLYAPALLYVMWRLRRMKAVAVALAGFIPLVAWEMFSLIYYGFPFPNTYYAKLHTGIPASELTIQGLVYFVDALHLDPLTLLVVAAAISATFLTRARAESLLALGVVVYLLYVARIGGDFMSGRFFAAPLLCSVIMLSRVPLPENWTGRLVPIAVVLVIGLVSPRPPLLSGKYYGKTGEGGINEKGLADERGWYYQSTGLLRVKRGEHMPAHRWIDRGRRLRLKEQPLHSESVVGFVGFAAGPEVHVVDSYGLTEPLLGRLPMARRRDWRIGHFPRIAPSGYTKTLKDGRNVIGDSGVAAYYDSLSLIIRGDIFDPQRLAAIWKMNTGGYNYLLAPYLDSPQVSVDYAHICDPKPEGTAWDQTGNYVIRSSGLMLHLDTTYKYERVEISVDHNDYYAIIYYRDSLEVGFQKIDRQKIPQGGLRVDTLVVPADAVAAGYDRVEIYPEQGDDLFSVGHFRVLPKISN